MVNNLQPINHPLPDGHPPGVPALILDEIVGQKVHIGCQFPATKIGRFPDIVVRRLWVAPRIPRCDDAFFLRGL
jgi:hypothetical protein